MKYEWLRAIGKASSALRCAAEYDDLLSDQAKDELRVIASTLSEIEAAYHGIPGSLQSRYEQAIRYSVDLQRAIQFHCHGQRVPDMVSEGCPHHAKMLNEQTERAIGLRREGADTVVCVEAGWQWVEVIREPFDCQFSHIVEPSGIAQLIKEAATGASEIDLRASGGIVDAP